MNESEYTERIEEYRGDMYRGALSVLRNEADAEDAVGNAILRGFENLSQLRDAHKFRPWILQITRNEALKILKKRMELPGDEVVAAMLTPVENQYDELWDVIKQINEEYQKVIILFYYDGLSLNEISATLDIPVGTVKSRLSRGKKALRQLLEGKEDQMRALEKKEKKTGGNKKFFGILALVVVLVTACVGGLLFAGKSSEASFWGHFTQKIRDFFGITKEEAVEKGIESSDNKAVSKPDLMLEMYEQVMDERNVYLIVKITAPTEVEFSEDIGFSYFAFSKGDNYNAEQLIGGSTDCKLQQTLDDKKNVATYVLSLSATEDLKENEKITVTCKDLAKNPFGDSPEVLVEGMWSLTFPVSFTVKDKVSIKGTEEMTYPFVGTNAKVQKVKMTPLGLTIISDISEAPTDELGVLDTSVSVKLKMLDGTEKVVASHDLEEKTIVNGGGTNFDMKKKTTIMTNSYEFAKKIAVNEVLGVYIEDLYISFIS